MAWHGEMRGLNETVIPAGHPGFRLSCQGKSSSTTEKCLELHLEGFYSAVMKSVVKHWNRLPRAMVVSPFLQGLKKKKSKRRVKKE